MLENAIAVLELFEPNRREISVTEAAELLGRPKSTLSRWLSAMDRAGFLDRDPESGRYRVSLRLAAIGELARHATSLQRLARPALEELTAATGETSNLVVLAGTEGVSIETATSPRPVLRAAVLGRRFPLHASATGKSLLAWRSEEEIRGLLRTPLERITPATITDLDPLLAQLESVRAQGYSVSWEEMEAEVVAVAAPVRDHLGKVVASVCITAPTTQVSREALPTLGKQVMEAAALVSRGLGYR